MSDVINNQDENILDGYKEAIKKLYKQTSVLSVVATGLFIASLFLALALLM